VSRSPYLSFLKVWEGGTDDSRPVELPFLKRSCAGAWGKKKALACPELCARCHFHFNDNDDKH
jgi:hypothetical protein